MIFLCKGSATQSDLHLWWKSNWSLQMMDIKGCETAEKDGYCWCQVECYWNYTPFIGTLYLFYRVCTWQWHHSQCSSYTRFADKVLVMTVLSSKTLELCCYLLTYSLWGVIGIPQFLELYLVSGAIWVFSHLFYYPSFWWNLLTFLASTNFDFYSIKANKTFLTSYFYYWRHLLWL